MALPPGHQAPSPVAPYLASPPRGGSMALPPMRAGAQPSAGFAQGAWAAQRAASPAPARYVAPSPIASPIASPVASYVPPPVAPGSQHLHRQGYAVSPPAPPPQALFAAAGAMQMPMAVPMASGVASPPMPMTLPHGGQAAVAAPMPHPALMMPVSLPSDGFYGQQQRAQLQQQALQEQLRLAGAYAGQAGAAAPVSGASEAPAAPMPQQQSECVVS
eukprot:TRINITY_DN39089_c0_g1_i1.p2 TRINITY_DN39089_c0_g1~~TRINITY_DN39089_c0_g1_i1.p2  ORF type:complete len:246 (+),score=58.73 TRINITY_DN39089_c0_g1_i1:88-738(+)